MDNKIEDIIDIVDCETQTIDVVKVEEDSKKTTKKKCCKKK